MRAALLAAALLLAAPARGGATRGAALDRAEAFIGYAEKTAPPGIGAITHVTHMHAPAPQSL
jgi:hypothetical protein